MMREQFIWIDARGNKRYFKDREMKIRHREDGPAIEWVGGSKSWFINGKCHREDGPATVQSNGDKYWYINGFLHREDGPAIEYVSGEKHWLINGKRHREDGPAVEYQCGYREWYIDGEELTEEEFNARTNPVELTLEEIAEKFGVSVDQLKIKK